MTCITGADIGHPDLRKQAQAIGDICGHWACLEFYVELAMWWLLGLDYEDGALMTERMDIEYKAKLLRRLASKKLKGNDAVEIAEIMKEVASFVPLRHLVVHGMWAIDYKAHVIAFTARRGEFKDKPITMNPEETVRNHGQDSPSTPAAW